MKITKVSQVLLAFIISCLPFRSESSPEVSAAISGQSIFTEKLVTVTSGKKGSVLIFMSSQCPCSNSHVQVVKKLAKDFSEFAFAVVHSNTDESLASSRDYFKTVDFSFPGDKENKAYIHACLIRKE